jgi:hypothetical protein
MAITQDNKFMRGQSVNVRYDGVSHRAKIKDYYAHGMWTVRIDGKDVHVDEKDICEISFGAAAG